MLRRKWDAMGIIFSTSPCVVKHYLKLQVLARVGQSLVIYFPVQYKASISAISDVTRNSHYEAW